MAQFWEPFNYPATAGLPEGMTARFTTAGATWDVVDDATASDGKSLSEVVSGVNTARGASLDAPGMTITDGQVFIKQRGGSTYAGAAIRCSGTNYGYWAFFTSTKLYIGYANGSTLGSATFSGYNATDYFCILLEASGTTIRAKAWKDGDAIPSSWTVSVVNSNYSSGWGGLMGFSSAYARSVDAIGIGTDGDPAPTAPKEGSQFFTDFSEYANDQQPTGWTKRIANTTYNALVKTKAGTTGGKCLELSGASGAYRWLTWDDVTSADTVEVVLRLRSAATGGLVGGLVRLSGTTSSDVSCYMGAFQVNGDYSCTTLKRWASGLSMSLGDSAYFAALANTWYGCRFRVGDSTLAMRYWNDGEQEPSTWSHSKTDSQVSAAGLVGLGLYCGGSYSHDVDLIGVGLNGWPAPTAPLGGGADTTPPTITIVSVDRDKVSDETGMTRCTLVFRASEDIQAWEVRQDGAGVGQGTLLESGGAASANSDITAYIDWNEITGGDGTKEINIYAQDTAGNWAPYHQA